MRSVIFDLDGTLADTSGDLIASANVCFRGLGLGDLLDPVQDAETAFHGGRAMLRLGFSRVQGFGDADIEGQFPVLLQAYGDAIDVHTTLYPGAMQAVQQIKDSGYLVGICTNKPEGLAETLLQRLGIRDVFGALIGADTLPVRKPDPTPLIETVKRLGGDPRRTCLIGDTHTDRETARAAGVPSVLVTFGPAGQKVLDLSPEAIIGHFDELLGVVDQFGL